uniref:Uncharacterized protein n=1 Tax=Amphimedon queenslandica TaxID=400682 RepID=A0A1X7TLY4_AMPQE
MLLKVGFVYMPPNNNTYYFSALELSIITIRNIVSECDK